MDNILHPQLPLALLHFASGGQEAAFPPLPPLNVLYELITHAVIREINFHHVSVCEGIKTRLNIAAGLHNQQKLQ